MPEQIKYLLDEEQIPKSWYNLSADLPEPVPPVLHSGTQQPIGPADLEPLFPTELIEQEVSPARAPFYSLLHGPVDTDQTVRRSMTVVLNK